ncbi:MAG: hypothetical protein Q9191_007247 [Dirinaria sp. TL-2023a]
MPAQSLSYLLPLLASLSQLTISAPTTLYPRQTQQTCAQFDSITGGAYAVQNDIWGASASGDQQQCSTITSASGDGTLAWSTTFNWQGTPDQVKTYANAEASSITTCKPLNQYHSIPTTWDWSYGSAQITGDVSYDAFLAPVCNGPGDPHKYEIMVWLAALGGLNPIGSAGPSVQIGGQAWTLWSGPNQQTGATVFSFVAGAGQVGSYSGDLIDFFNYLVQNNGVDASLQLTSVQAGTEVASGQATFTTSKFSIGAS